MRNWLIQEQLLRKSNPHFQLIESSQLGIDLGLFFREFHKDELVTFRKSHISHRMVLDGLGMSEIEIQRRIREKFNFKIIKLKDKGKY